MQMREASGKPTQRGYSPEEKAQAVRMVRALRKELGTAQGTIGRVTRQLGYGVESVRQWVKRAEIDAGEAAGTTTAESARIKQLEQENRELRRAGGSRAPTTACPPLQRPPSRRHERTSRSRAGRTPTSHA